jgi:hypothetical protein
MNDKEWKETLGQEWKMAEKELGVDWEYGPNGEHLEYKTHCLPRCPRCQGTLQTVNIHGHEQCVLCHSVVDDCCQGVQLK